jgi:integration host factor subunit alpha
MIKSRLIAGEDVITSGFGKWNVKSKHSRRGRNPQTGEQMVLDARKVVTWSYSPVSKKAVNGAGNGLKK